MALSIEDSLEPLSSEAGTTDKDEVVVESEGAQVESLDEDFTEEEAAAGEEAVSEDVGKTEETIEETDATNEEESDPVVTEEDTHTKVTRTDKSTTDSSGNIEAQGEIRGPDVDTSIHQDADGSVAQGADGTEGAAGAGRVDGHAPEETVKNTDDSAAPTDATKADADTGDNDDGTE